MTQRDRYIRYLEAHGWKRDYTAPRSGKYIKYSHHARVGWYYLGRNGAVRFSWTNKLSGSFDRAMLTSCGRNKWEKANGYTID
jgi:hypothetical protein